MSNPSPLADKVYDVLRATSDNPKKSEILFTAFSQKVADVFLHIGKLTGDILFEPGLRCQHLLKTLSDKREESRDVFEDYCIDLAEAYCANNTSSTIFNHNKELSALIEPVMELYHPSLMAAKKDNHTLFFQKNMVEDMVTRFNPDDATISYFHYPDFQVTHLQDIVHKQPYRQTKLLMFEYIQGAFDDFKSGSYPHIPSAIQPSLASYYMIERADFYAQRNAHHIQFKIHADTENSVLTASGPFFDAHIDRFRDAGFSVTTHEPHTQSIDENVLWNERQNNCHYKIA
jgi:hypothetical protein